MAKKSLKIGFTDEAVMNKILLVRSQKVMLDRDLAELYGVTTKRLNEQVRRNLKKFPKDFMFQLNEKEKDKLVTTHDYLQSLKFSKTLPYAFTEHGAVMLASVLNSDRAIEVNIQIVRIFTKMKSMLLTHKDILLKLEKAENKMNKHDDDIALIFKYIKQLLTEPEPEPRTRIGFRREKETD